MTIYGDGFPDSVENGDFDGDGVPDQEQDKGQIKTAVNGGGSMGVWCLALLGLLVLGRKYWGGSRRFARVAMVGGLVSVPAAQAADCASEGYRFGSCWYVGAGAGVSQLEPEGRSNGWGVDDSSSTATEIHLGQYISPKWFWELKYTDAGEAGLSNLNPALTALVKDAAITYKIPSLMAGYVVWDTAAVDVYVKAGVSSISTECNDRRIGVKEQTTAQFAVGAGVRYNLAQSWSIDVGLDSYDRDARVLALGLSRRFD